MLSDVVAFDLATMPIRLRKVSKLVVAVIIAS